MTLLVNNAGVNPTHGWKTCIDVMLVGASYGAFLAMEKMSISNGKKGGRIVNIASMAGLWPNRGLRKLDESGYSMAKFGTIAMTRSFSQNEHFSSDGIKAMALCPWFTNTQFVTTVFSTDAIEQKFKYRVLEVSEVLNLICTIMYTIDLET